MNWMFKSFFHAYLKFGKQQCFTVGFKGNFTKKTLHLERKEKYLSGNFHSSWFLAVFRG